MIYTVEKSLERKLFHQIKNLGGEALKLSSQFHRGLPDRLVLLPGGQTYFVELKSTGKRPTKLQALTHERLRSLGYKVFVIDDDEKLKSFIDEIHTT